jgi:uncharacterized protein VirK/YbjX
MRPVRSLVDSLRHRNDWHNLPPLRAVRYVLRTAIAPQLHAQWLARLNTPVMREATLRDGHLFERWQHRWINRRFTARERLVRLIDHHGVMPQLIGSADLSRLYRGETLIIGEATGKDGSCLQATLSAPILRCLEGELMVGLAWRGSPVFSMTVTLCPAHGETLVGCIQGPRSEHGLALVRELTKACHGLRPKDLLLSVVRAMSLGAGIAHIRGPGNQWHVFGGMARLKASYDTFWDEAGGVPQENGMFQIPAQEPLRDILEVASKHRSAFRAREAFREGLSAEVTAYLMRRPYPTARVSINTNISMTNAA